MGYSKILIVDDEPGIREKLRRWLTTENYQTVEAATAKEALSLLRQSNFKVILLDLKLPDRDGYELLEDIRFEFPDICVIVLTGFSTAESPAKARKAGAFDFFEKPIQFDALLERIDDAVKRFHAKRQADHQREEEQQNFQFENIIGKSDSMQCMFRLIQKAAPTEESILITGENGTGKDLVAGAIHFNSQRKQHPFITANCATLKDTVVESMLFGHEKGAFTGAIARKIGKFELADTTSLFIDEVGELSPSLQTKFLQFLQHKTFERLGSNESIAVDVRIIAATNADLQQAVAEKCFREDLYFRLSRIIIRVPPLRERISDIPLLTSHFIKRYNRRNAEIIEGISGAALELLQNYHFPGNVRELENIIVRAILFESGELIKADTIRSCLNPYSSNSVHNYHDMSFRDARQQFEKEYFSQILDQAKGNISRAANIAGIDRSHFRNKLKELGLR